MPPSPRYTVRLPPALDAQVQARVRAGMPFAVLIRDALSAYLADTPPTPHVPTPADTADTVQALQEQLAALTQRVEVLEQQPTRRRPPADRRADTPPTGADAVARPAGGPRKLTRRQAAALRAKRQVVTWDHGRTQVIAPHGRGETNTTI